MPLSPRLPFAAAAACACLMTCCLCPPTGAQETAGEPPRPGEPVESLKAALPFVNWDDRTRGPLIAIAADKVTWQNRDSSLDDGQNTPDDDAARQQLLAPQDRYGLSADLVARHFQRKVVRLPTLSIYAPTRMFLLQTDLKPANPFLGAETWDKMRRLEATLTEAQWKKLGSAEGLGLGDLGKEQQPLLDDILPPQMTVEQETTKRYESGYLGSETVDGSERTLTPRQRMDVRVHLTRQANFTLVDAKSQNLPLSSGFHSDPIGGQKWGLGANTQTHAEQSSVFGQPIRRETSNRLKPSDLDLKQPVMGETWVPLTGAKTVADLLKAAGAKTGMELYADDRLGRLPVALSTEARLVHASDLLEALCWSLTATFRKVGPVPGGDPKDFAYVLTYDRRGLAAIHGQIADWSRRGTAQRQENNTHFDESIKKFKPGQYVSYAKGDPLTPTPEALRAMRDSERERTARMQAGDYGEYSNTTVPVQTLTAEQRQQMDEELKRFDKQQANNVRANNSNPPVARTDKVGLWTAFGISFVIPGVGEIRDTSQWGDDANMDGPSSDDAEEESPAEAARRQREEADLVTSLKQGPATVTRAVLSIAPAAAGEAEPILMAARGNGISEVWVSAPDTNAGRALLAQCAAMGKAHGVLVVAQVGLIYAPASAASANAAREDVNAFGETGAQWAAHVKGVLDGFDQNNLYMMGSVPRPSGRDLLAPEATETRRGVGEMLRQVAAIPGLAGISLHEAAGAGHNWRDEPQYEGYWTGTSFGYTVANRLAFLRQNHYDPLDVEGQNYEYGWLNLRDATKLPYFDTVGAENVYGYYESSPEMDKPVEAWHKQTASGERDFLLALRAEIEKAHPHLRVYLGNPDGSEISESDTYLRWDDATKVPVAFTPEKAPPAIKKPIARGTRAGAAKLAVAPPAIERLYRLEVIHDYLSDAREGIKALEIKEPALKNVPPGAILASYIRESMKNRFVDWSMPLKVRSKLPPPPPQAVLLDCKGAKTDDILTLLKGALHTVDTSETH